MKIIFVAFALIAFVGADVSHLSSNYLPPQEAGPAPIAIQEAQAPQQDYIPPQQEEEIAAPIAQAPIEIAEQEQGVSGDEGTEVGADGYRYKTVKRIRYRYRV